MLFALMYTVSVLLIGTLALRASPGKRRWFFMGLTLSLLLVGLVFGTALWLGQIPPEAVTITTMQGLAIGITDRYHRSGRIPTTLSEWAHEQGIDREITDGWGRAILFRRDGDSTITVESLGKDGRKGGTGRDADITLTFDAAEPY